MKANVQQRVKDALLDGLKKDGLKWFKPWKGGLGNNPINHVTGRAYTGLNVFFLNAMMRVGGFEHNEWLTFNAAKKAGLRVSKGSKSTPVYFFNVSILDVENNKFYKSIQAALDAGADMSKLRKVFALKEYKVFNIAQLDECSPKRVATELDKNNDPVEAAEAIVNGYNAAPKINLVEGSDEAYYVPTKDLVVCPVIDQFVDATAYYKTLFHELVHSTGHESRLNRKEVATTDVLNKTRADYAFEELVAESGAMMLTGHAGLPDIHEENSQAYINGWVKAVEEAKESAVVTALVRSSKAVAHILGE
jgi:antirestriction protein ArdC